MHLPRLNISKSSLELRTIIITVFAGMSVLMAFISLLLVLGYSLQLIDCAAKYHITAQGVDWSSSLALSQGGHWGAASGMSGGFLEEVQAMLAKVAAALLVFWGAIIAVMIRIVSHLIRPFEVIGRQTAAIRNGDWSISLDERQGGSMGALAVSINEIVQQLQYFYRLSIKKDRELEDLNINLEAIINMRTEKLKKLAITDALTGVYNHRHIVECLAVEIELANQYHAPLALAIFDIDFFKQVNDNYGHVEGDKVLICVAACLQQNVRHKDILGRYGGEEFFLILPQTDLGQAYSMVERLRVLVSHLCIGERQIQVTVSAGVAGYQGDSMEDFIRRADRSLYHAKKSGRNKSIQDGRLAFD